MSSGLSLTVAHFWININDRWSRLRLWIERVILFLNPHRSVNTLRGFILSSYTALQSINGRYWFSECLIKTSRLAGFAFLWVFDTVARGFAFLIFQVFEYIASFFTISDSVYGSLFFALTGLHGSHVFIGVIMLAMSVFSLAFIFAISPRIRFLSLKSGVRLTDYFDIFTHRVAFDGAVWYWHFVDVIWLFVLLFLYW